MDLWNLDKLYVVCECNDVSFGEIVEAIKNGACSVEKIMEMTSAETGCGLCAKKENDPAGKRAIHLDEILEWAKAEGLCKS